MSGATSAHPVLVEDYVILVRHASRLRDPELSEEAHRMAGRHPAPTGWRESLAQVVGGAAGATAPISGPTRPEPGEPLTRALTGALADQLTLEGIVVTRMAHSRHAVAEDTAKLMASILRSRGCAMPTLAPAPSRQLTPGSSDGKFPADLPPPAPGPPPHAKATAVVLVGHQPDLTRIARLLLQRRRGLVPPPWFVSGLPAGCLPLDNSEMACVRTRGPARLRWILSEKPPELLADLRDKIRSKLDVAKFFVGALVINGGILLNKDLWSLQTAPSLLWLVGLGFTLLAGALGFAVCTLLAYDRLAMPSTFWSDAGQAGSPPDPPRWTVLRPPSQAHLILFYEMVHVWSWYFIPALVCSLAAITCLIGSMMIRNVDAFWLPEVTAGAVVVVGLGATAIYALYEYGKLRLGFDD